MLTENGNTRNTQQTVMLNEDTSYEDGYQKSESSSKDTNRTVIELLEDESLLIARREADEVRTSQMYYKSTWSVEALYFV